MDSLMTKIKLTASVVGILIVIFISSKMFTVLDAGEYIKHVS